MLNTFFKNPFSLVISYDAIIGWGISTYGECFTMAIPEWKALRIIATLKRMNQFTNTEIFNETSNFRQAS